MGGTSVTGTARTHHEWGEMKSFSYFLETLAASLVTSVLFCCLANKAT